MGFFDKVKVAFRKIKTKLIVYFVVIVVVAIMGVAPLALSIEQGNIVSQAGGDFWAEFLTQIFNNIQKPLNSLGQCFSSCLPTYLETLKYYLLVSLFFALIGIIKAIPTHEFQDIENGSSDWSENGEQYTVLSKKKGIVLAEKNYLPVDKRGNVNVLVVRRFWCW